MKNLQITTNYRDMCTQKSRFDSHIVTDTLSTFLPPLTNQRKNKVDLHIIGSSKIRKFYSLIEKPYVSVKGFTDTLSQIRAHITQQIKLISRHGQGLNNLIIHFKSVSSKRKKS